MVATKSKSAKRPVGKLVRFKISIEHAMGPYASSSQVQAVKSKIKQRVPHATFTAMKKTSRGISFSTRTSYTKPFAAGVSASAVKAHLAASAPGAKVSVSRA